jgi:hypothetical protein
MGTEQSPGKPTTRRYSPEELGGVNNLLNVVNPVGQARLGLMPVGYRR